MAGREDDISSLCSRILDHKLGTYEEFHDAVEGEMEDYRLNAVLFGTIGFGKSALIILSLNIRQLKLKALERKGRRFLRVSFFRETQSHFMTPLSFSRWTLQKRVSPPVFFHKCL